MFFLIEIALKKKKEILNRFLRIQRIIGKRKIENYILDRFLTTNFCE